MAEHTGGPWVVQIPDNPMGRGSTDPQIVQDEPVASRRLIAIVPSLIYAAYSDAARETVRQERMANAHLIAAAPKMLAFIRRVAWEPIGASEASHKEILEIIEAEAKQLLAEAEGRTNG